jgi:hypothetical protein
MRNNTSHENQIVYLTYEQAIDLVDRIAERTENFNHTMTDNEKQSMSYLVSDIGVKVSDIIDVSLMADNYAINAEIVTPDDYDNYSMREVRQDRLFSWQDNGETYYCLTW